MVGGTIPYIIRDPEFNESGLLDLKTFARYTIAGDPSGPALGVELLASLPTAAQGGSYPLTLDTSLLKLTLAASGKVAGWKCGLNLGYQSYLDSDSGDDSDLFYGFYAAKEMGPLVTGLVEYSASRHTHTESSLEQEITDATALVGLRYRFRDNLTLGLAVGSGTSDSFADLRSQATIIWLPGGAHRGRAHRRRQTGER